MEFTREPKAMRDPEAYVREGRSNPHDPQQMLEHPYDFVSLPARPEKVAGVGHDRYPVEDYSGTLTLVYETLTPVHIGSGSFERAVDCGLSGKETVVRGIVRRDGAPVLPGSSWKGAVRARFEAITRSTLALARTSHKEEAWKVPGPLRVDAQRSHEVRIRDQRVLRTLKAKILKYQDDPESNRRQLRDLSPAEALFGTMGYRGRIHPGDGVVAGPVPQEPLRAAPMESPLAHRLAKPGAARKVSGRPKIEILEVEGRKFYYDGDLETSRRLGNGDARGYTHELVDCIPPGCTIKVEAHLEAVNLEELGALLVAAGYGKEIGIVRFGGFKPAGLGKVSLIKAEAHCLRGSSARSWKRPPLVSIDLEQAVSAARAGLIDQEALRELHQITTLRRE
jgi:CRISPR/Cas system CSM-associated protein Csm3 (group 7 of RAMP superfamily)